MNTSNYKIWENPNKSEIIINSREALEKWKWIKTEKINYTKNWESGIYESVTRSTKNWVVAILPITQEGEIILIEETRIPIISDTSNWRCIWIPAWLVDDWEPKQQSALREMNEEIWFTTQSENIHYVDTVLSSEWMTNEEVDIFIALNCFKIKDILNWYKNVGWLNIAHESGENINAIYSIPYKEIYDFLDMAREEWMKKWGKIDCALSHFERKFLKK